MSFIISIVLARLLAPEVYGTVALVTVFTVILQVFVDSGLGKALVQKKDADQLDFSSVFYFNVATCILLYSVMFFLAPFIADFYNNPELVAVVRVISFTLVISGIKNIQQAYVAKHMLFKKFFFSTIGGITVSAVVGIVLAYQGFGVWALVAQSLTNQIVDTFVLWFTVKWRPGLMFSWQRMKGLYSYGWKLLLSALIDKVYIEIRQLIIGKMYSTSDLAFYNKGQQFPTIIVTNINSSIDSVLLPVMSKVQDDRNTVKLMTRRAISTSSYLIWPFMVGLAVCAEPLIRLLLTETWLPCVPYLRIFCFTMAFYPVHTANLNAIKAMGRSDLFLKLEIIKKTIGLFALLISMWFGVFWMAASLPITTLLNSFINAYPNKKLMNYSYFEQIKDMLPAVAMSALMGLCVYLLQFIGFSDIVTLFVQVFAGVILYVVFSVLFKIESFTYVKNMLMSFLH